MANKKFSHVLIYLWQDFKRSYSDPYVRKLCIWWAFAFGAYVQVLLRVYNLNFSFYLRSYREINRKRKFTRVYLRSQVYTYINVLYTYVLNLNEDSEFTLYNGAAESLNTLIGNNDESTRLLYYVIMFDRTERVQRWIESILKFTNFHRGDRCLFNRQTRIELAESRISVLGRGFHTRRTRVARLLLRSSHVVHLCFLHNLRMSLSDNVNCGRVSICLHALRPIVGKQRS